MHFLLGLFLLGRVRNLPRKKLLVDKLLSCFSTFCCTVGKNHGLLCNVAMSTWKVKASFCEMRHLKKKSPLPKNSISVKMGVCWTTKEKRFFAKLQERKNRRMTISTMEVLYVPKSFFTLICNVALCESENDSFPTSKLSKLPWFITT